MRPLYTILGGLAAGILAGIVLRRRDNDGPTGTSKLDMQPLDDYATQETTQAGQCDPVAKPGVLAFRKWVLAQYQENPGAPQNILRDCATGSPSEHWEGRAWDFMIPSLDVGQALVDRLLAPDASGRPHALARRAGIMYLIFNRRMWRAYPSSAGPSGSWGPYNGPSAHTDHVHMSFSWKGARGETSLYEALRKGEAIA